MTGLDDEDFGPEDYRPAPHPDDRLWRHPSEMFAFHAAQAAERAAKELEDADNEADRESADPDADITVELPAVGTTRSSTPGPTPALVARASDDADARRAQRHRNRPNRVHRGLIAAAAAVAVGATALTVGALSARSDSSTITAIAAEPIAAQFDGTRSANASSSAAADTDAVEPDAGQAAPQANPVGPIATLVNPQAEAALASRLHDELADSLPRIQAASPNGMVEGSGLFVTEQGHIVTSARLVANSDYILAWTNDGQRLPATVVAVDWFSDVAIVHVESPSAPMALFSDDTTLWSGQYAMSIDYDNGSMSVGAVDSLTAAQAVNELGDAASRVRIAPGALPGSAIVDDTGSVIAMVNMGPGSISDQLHATPAWMIERVVEELMDHGVAMHPWLGIQVSPEPGGTHVAVQQVVADSPAFHAGVRVGDLIDAVNGEAISTTMSLWTLVQLHTPGDYVDLAVTRNGQRRLISAHLVALVN